MKAFLFFLPAVLTSLGTLLAQDAQDVQKIKVPLRMDTLLSGSEKVNYELRTTNCELTIQPTGRIVTPHLMMDPVEGEKIVESFEGVLGKRSNNFLGLEAIDHAQEIKEAEEVHTCALQEKQRAIAATGMGKSVNAATATTAAENACNNKIAWREKAKQFFNKATTVDPEHALQLTRLAQTYTRAAEETWLAENVWRARAKKKLIPRPSRIAVLTKAFSAQEESTHLRKQTEQGIQRAIMWASKPQGMPLSAWAERMRHLELPMGEWEVDPAGEVKAANSTEAVQTTPLISEEHHVIDTSQSKIDVERKDASDIDEDLPLVSLTLDHFKTAVAAYPKASRLVIVEDGEMMSIQSRDEDVPASSKNRSENRQIMKALRACLPLEIADLEFPQATLESGSYVLSAQRLHELLDVIERLEFLDQLDIGERYSSRSQSTDSFGDFETSSLSFSSASDSIFTAPAFLEEKDQVAQVIQQMIKASTREMRGERYYAEADKIWIQDHQAWIDRSVAQRELNAKKAISQQAEELLAKVTEARAQIDAQKTLLGRISKYSAKAAVPLSFIPGPVPCGGIAHTVSEVTDKLNQIWVNKDVVLAQQAVTHATEEVEQTTQKAEALHGTAMALRKQAQEAEERARLLERAAQKDDVERLRPPVTSFDEEAWKNWATAIVQAGKGNPDAISIFANHGMSDSLWAMEIVDDVLAQKNVEDLKTEEEQQRIRIAPFEEVFQSASKALQEAEKTTHQAETEATKARQRLESATQIHAHRKSELETINEAFNELEKPENMRKPGSAYALEKKKEEFCSALIHFEESCNDLKPCEEALAKAYEVLATEDAKAAPLRNKAAAAEQRLQRIQERVAVYQEKQGSEQNSQVVLRLTKTGEAGDLTIQKITQHLEKLDVKNKGIIIPPEVLDKTYETIGKSLLKAQQKGQSLTCLKTNETTVATLEEVLKTTELMGPVSKGSMRLLPEIREPRPSDFARWEAAHHAEDFMEEKDHVITQIKERSASSQSTEKTEKKSAKAPKKAHALSSIQEEEEGRDSLFDQDRSLSPLRIRSQSSQRHSKNSETSVRSKSVDSKNSIGSFLTSKTGMSKAGSITDSIPASISSVASKSEMKGLKAAMCAINEAARRWAEYVRQADAERVAVGGVPYPDEEALFDAWQRADAMAEAAWKKRCALQEETLRAVKMASTWEEDTVRWEARAEADRLGADEKEAEADLVALAEQQKPLDSSWRAQNNAASLHLEQVQKAAKAAQQKWSRLAELEESVKMAQGSDEKKRALIQLQEKDQAVMTLWEEVREDYYKEQEVETRRAHKERLAQEGGAYKFDLLTQKSELVAECFGDAESDASLSRYKEATMREALRAARERISGAETAWELRVSKALKDCKEAQTAADAVSSSNEKEGKAHDLQKTAARLTAIAEADSKALETLKEETERLGNIEKNWRTQLAVEEKAPAMKRLAAVRLWEQGDPSSWNALSHKEREAYNEAVIAANEALTDSAVSRIQEAQENTQEWSRKAIQAWRIFSKKSTEQIAEQTKKELTQIKKEEDERRVAIRVSKLHDFSNKAEQEETLLHATSPTEANDQSKILALALHEIAEMAMKNAKAFCDDLGISWARKASVVQVGFRQAARYAKRASEAWHQLAEAKRIALSQIPLEPVLGDSEFQKMMENATADLIQAEKGKYVWMEKRTLAKKNSLETLDPKVLQAKAAFEEVRAVWEAMRCYPVPEVAVPMAELIKSHVTNVVDMDIDVKEALIALSSTADALANLSTAARSHSRIITATSSSIPIIGNGFSFAVVSSFAVAGSFVVATAVFTGGMALIPITLGGFVLYQRYYPTPLAPRTTELARTVICAAQETVETAVHATSETIWAADTAWCRDAIRDADEFVTAITGAETAEEAEEIGEAEVKAEKK